MKQTSGDAADVASIFAGSMTIIGNFFALAAPETIKQKLTCRKVAANPIECERFYLLAQDLYEDFACRRRNRNVSSQNWRWALQTELNKANRSPEVLIERALAVLATQEIGRAHV